MEASVIEPALVTFPTGRCCWRELERTPNYAFAHRFIRDAFLRSKISLPNRFAKMRAVPGRRPRSSTVESVARFAIKNSETYIGSAEPPNGLFDSSFSPPLLTGRVRVKTVLSRSGLPVNHRPAQFS